MKAMILAAGKGTRVRPITYAIPKPMIPIMRKPVMESIIELLSSHGIQDIVINTSHLASVIENYFRDGSHLGVELAYSYEGILTDNGFEDRVLGSAGGMKKIQSFSGFFDQTFIVLCGDAWIDLDIQAALTFHREKGGIASIVLQEVPHEEVYKYGVVELANDQRILRFQEKPAPEDAVSNLINTGIYIFEPEIFDYIPAQTEYDIGGELFPSLVAADIAFYGLEMDFQWVDIGSVPDVWGATRSALLGNIAGFKMPGHEIRPGVWAGNNLSVDWDQVEIVPPVYIGSSTRIEAGARITGPCMIGANCIIDGAADIRDCIIDDYKRVSGLGALDQKLIIGEHCISVGGMSFDIDSAMHRLLDDARYPQEAISSLQAPTDALSRNNKNKTRLSRNEHEAAVDGF